MAAIDGLVLEAAAVLGRDFEWQLLAPATGQPAERVAAALTEGGRHAAQRGRRRIPVP